MLMFLRNNLNLSSFIKMCVKIIKFKKFYDFKVNKLKTDDYKNWLYKTCRLNKCYLEILRTILFCFVDMQNVAFYILFDHI